ncbi:MAG: SRPBCC domain-containing protein [Deltaproteobacteria bacterium]|nr:SRPBCC domain-containing protein [Deltaproteobacteria bacterium]
MNKNPPFSTSFTVQATPQKVFDAINHVRGWWSGQITGPTDELGREFVYRYEDRHRSHQKVTELVPGKKVTWEVTEASLSFPNPGEWNGTRIEFELREAAGGTQVRFTHHGLLPACQCYADCSGAWTFFVTESLPKFILTGKGAEFAP